MSTTLRSFLERLAGLVPGYAGYAARENRRETDQALRRAVAARLSAARRDVASRSAEAATAMRFDALEPLEALGRRMESLGDRVLHAPAGYAGLFDAVQVEAPLLDRLHAADFATREAVDRLAALVAPSAAFDLAAARAALDEVEASVRTRDELLSGVR